MTEVQVPKEWTGHFDKETLNDLWVYMNYGNMSPEQALAAMGLKAPLNEEVKTIVGNQIEVAKPEVRVSPEIPNSKNKEVREMVEVKEKPQMTYPSTEGQGHEPVELRRPSEHNDLNSLMGAALDTVKINQLPNFLKERFKEALNPIYDTSDLSRTINHYVGVLAGRDVVDSKSLNKLKSLAQEADESRGNKEKMKSIYEKTVEVLGSLRVTKRRK